MLGDVETVDARDVRAGSHVPRRVVAFGQGGLVHEDRVCAATVIPAHRGGRREDHVLACGLVVDFEAVERIANETPHLRVESFDGRCVEGLLPGAELHAFGTFGVVEIVGGGVQADGVPSGILHALGDGEGAVPSAAYGVFRRASCNSTLRDLTSNESG